MDASIVEFFNRTPRKVTAVVDETFFRILEDQTSEINRIFPLVNYLDRRLLLLKIVKHMTAGYFIAEEQDVPGVKSRSVLREEIIGNQKIGKKYTFTGRDFETMHEMRMYLATTGPQGAALATEMERYFWGILADLMPAMEQIFTWVMFQIMINGAIDYTDPLTGYRVQMAYPNLISALLPAALTGAARWNQPATAEGLRNLEDHTRTYFDEFGMWPDEIVLRWHMIRDLANQAATKNAFLSLSGIRPDPNNAVNPIYVSDAAIMDMIMARTHCQRVTMIDAQIEIEDASGGITPRYLVPDNTYLFLEVGNQHRAVIPTVEKDFQPGACVIMERTSEIPRREHCVGVMNCVPFVEDDRKISSRVVA